MVSKYEIRAKKELEAEGWRVDDKRGMSRFSKNRDFWNLFDLVCVKRGEPMRWISIKGHNSNQRGHREAIQDFWLPEGNIKELWRWPGNKQKTWIKTLLPNTK